MTGWRGVFAFRTLLDHGATLAFGSDWPVVSCDPMLGIHAAVTGRTLDGEVFMPEQTLSAEQAMTAYTAGAAHALGMNDAGRLAPGALGDFVMFDRDPFAIDWCVERPEVVLTVIGGADRVRRPMRRDVGRSGRFGPVGGLRWSTCAERRRRPLHAMTLKGAILSIGDEMILGQCVDTNSAWLSDAAAEARRADR